MAHFSSSSEFRCSVAGLRGFLGCPANLPAVSNPDLELEILSAPDSVSVGARIEFRISAYGFKQKAVHEYVDVSDVLIIEQLIEGPMRQWKHEQHFEALADGHVRLTDEVHFDPPGGMLGYLLTEDRIRESLVDGMQCRYEVLQDLVNSGEIL